MINQYKEMDLELSPEEMNASKYALDLAQVSPEDVELALKITAVRRAKHGGHAPHNKEDNGWV